MPFEKWRCRASLLLLLWCGAAAENIINQCLFSSFLFKSCVLCVFLACLFLSAGQGLATFDNQFRVMCVAVHPGSPEVFLCGGYSAAVKAWDSRCSKVKLINLLWEDSSFLLTPGRLYCSLTSHKSEAGGLWARAAYPQPPPHPLSYQHKWCIYFNKRIILLHAQKQRGR